MLIPSPLDQQGAPAYQALGLQRAGRPAFRRRFALFA